MTSFGGNAVNVMSAHFAVYRSGHLGRLLQAYVRCRPRKVFELSGTHMGLPESSQK